jgi:DUF1707 SHOCT-like domain/Domain of unknown function (DUF4190)
VPYDPPTQLRASDADRESVAERLRVAASEGRLDPDELDERLTAAYAARWCSELERLTGDVTPRPPPPAPPVVYRPARTNALAIASFISAILWFGWFGSVAAVVCGHVALRQISRSGGAQSGVGFAVSGLVIGYFALAVLFAALAVMV